MSGLNFGTTADADDKTPITSHPFWPSIDVADFKKMMRIDDTVRERVRHALIQAITEANRQLVGFRQKNQALGIDALAKIETDDVIDGESMLIINYRQAVYQYAKARLLEVYADFSATKKGEDGASEKLEQADTYKREGHAAIAYVLGHYRVDAELI
jgi:hypothetical protein